MDFSKIISLVISLLGSSGAASDIIKLVLKLIPLVLGSLPKASDMDVAWVQRALKKLGFDPGPLDGVLGPLTQKAVVAFQQARGLDVDGWLGPETTTKLRMEAGDA